MTTRRDFLFAATLASIGASAPVHAAVGNIAPKKVLVLGGTGIIGPHQVHDLLVRGHTVTVFNRGRSGPGIFGKDVEELVGDRSIGLDALRGRKWDAVIDESASNGATAPGWVEASAAMLKDAVGQYLYVSSRAVYAGYKRVPMTAEAPVLTVDNSPLPPGTAMPYGLGKAYAEKAAQTAMPGKVTIVRPGVIVGPGDTTDRFTYWPLRVVRGGEILVPGDGTDRIQVIDVRDLTSFHTTLIENETFGVFNGLGPDGGLPFQEFIARIHNRLHGTGRYTWVGTDFLLNHKVEPLSDVPIWRPMRGDEIGYARFDIAPEIKAGLRLRPLENSAADALEWFRTNASKANPPSGRVGLSADREAELLALWKQQ